MVPVFYDLGRNKTKVWAFLGWELTWIEASFARDPKIEVRDKSGKECTRPITFTQDCYAAAKSDTRDLCQRAHGSLAVQGTLRQISNHRCHTGKSGVKVLSRPTTAVCGRKTASFHAAILGEWWCWNTLSVHTLAWEDRSSCRRGGNVGDCPWRPRCPNTKTPAGPRPRTQNAYRTRQSPGPVVSEKSIVLSWAVLKWSVQSNRYGDVSISGCRSIPPR
jgi:hypothetical protein